MKKLNNLRFLLSVLIALSINGICFSQNVGINSTGSAPNATAGLDIDYSNKGLLIPRVALVSSTDGVTIATPATSLLVYNPGTGGLTPAGYYYNSGTPEAPVWKRFMNGGAPGLPVYANNADAIAGGLGVGDLYRTGADPDPVMIVHAAPPGPKTVKALVIGGGGGGGGDVPGGGGGAGGYQYDEAVSVTEQAYTITVGGGGIGGTYPTTEPTNGGNSDFSTLSAIGGGHGSGYGAGLSGAYNRPPAIGGSGGGGTYVYQTGASGTSGQGYAGGNGRTGSGLENSNDGYASGGGGGAGAPGGNATATQAGAGGDGLTNSISGAPVTYAGGGGAASDMYRVPVGAGAGGAGGGGRGEDANGVAENGVDGTGGGGGGSYGEGIGGNGGSGVVIISYVTADFGACTGGTITTDGLNTVHTFTSDGTFTVVF